MKKCPSFFKHTGGFMATGKSEKNSSFHIEQQLDKVVSRFRGLQAKVAVYQKQAMALAQEGEVTARTSLHKVFDNGLSILGKGLSNGRKATESFVAETHRKAKKLQSESNKEEITASASAEVIPAEARKKTSKVSAIKASNSKVPTKKNKNKLNANYTFSARAH
jgi:hypothetical protein